MRLRTGQVAMRWVRIGIEELRCVVNIKNVSLTISVENGRIDWFRDLKDIHYWRDY
jgi:hypothetical protein